MSLFAPPTDAELAATFDRVATLITAGKLTRCPTDTGLDETIEAALTAAATATDKNAAITHARTLLPHHTQNTRGHASPAGVMPHWATTLSTEAFQAWVTSRTPNHDSR